MASYQYVYVMQNLSKVFPGGRELFKGITLSFLPGAKIGVLGVNGAGKSTLLKIMAGVDREFNGEAWAADGVRVGYLEQEPKLDPAKNVIENIMDGLGETRDLLKRFEEVSARFAEPMSDEEMNNLIIEQAELQEKSTPATAGTLNAASRSRWTPCAVRRPTPTLPSFRAEKNAGSPSAVCCCKSPTCCCWMNRPTIWTPNRSPGWRNICKAMPARW